MSLHSSRQIGQIDQVTVLLDANGDVLVPAGPKGDQTKKTAMSLTCKRQYDEKTLELPTAAGRWRGVCWYEEADASLRQAGKSERLSLSPSHRLIAQEISEGAVVPFCLKGPLSPEELDLVQAVGCSLPLDDLLPAEPPRPVSSGRRPTSCWPCSWAWKRSRPTRW